MSQLPRIFIVSSVALVLFAGCQQPAPETPDRQPPPRGRGGSPLVRLGLPLSMEYTVIPVETKGGPCRLVLDELSPVRTYYGRTVTWTVDGDCGDGWTVSLGEFTHQGAKAEPLVGRLSAPARNGQRIVATVKGQKETSGGLYQYRVFLTAPGGHEDEDASFLEICPDWPCPRFD